METGLLNVHREWNVVGGGGSTARTHRMLVPPLVKEDASKTTIVTLRSFLRRRTSTRNIYMPFKKMSMYLINTYKEVLADYSSAEGEYQAQEHATRNDPSASPWNLGNKQIVI